MENAPVVIKDTNNVKNKQPIIKEDLKWKKNAKIALCLAQAVD